MFSVRKIWDALFSCYLCLEMRLSTLSLTTCSFNEDPLKAVKNVCKFFRREIYSGVENKLFQENIFGLFMRSLAGLSLFPSFYVLLIVF